MERRGEREEREGHVRGAGEREGGPRQVEVWQAMPLLETSSDGSDIGGVWTKTQIQGHVQEFPHSRRRAPRVTNAPCRQSAGHGARKVSLKSLEVGKGGHKSRKIGA